MVMVVVMMINCLSVGSTKVGSRSQEAQVREGKQKEEWEEGQQRHITDHITAVGQGVGVGGSVSLGASQGLRRRHLRTAPVKKVGTFLLWL